MQTENILCWYHLRRCSATEGAAPQDADFVGAALSFVCLAAASSADGARSTSTMEEALAVVRSDTADMVAIENGTRRPTGKRCGFATRRRLGSMANNNCCCCRRAGRVPWELWRTAGRNHETVVRAGPEDNVTLVDCWCVIPYRVVVDEVALCARLFMNSPSTVQKAALRLRLPLGCSRQAGATATPSKLPPDSALLPAAPADDSCKAIIF